MRFRFYWKRLGGHTHVRVFAGDGETLGKCGELVFRNAEWLALADELVGCLQVEVKPDKMEAYHE